LVSKVIEDLTLSGQVGMKRTIFRFMERERETWPTPS